MFMLYAVLIGLVIGVLVRGSLTRLASLEFRWGRLAVVGLLLQIVLFSGPVSATVGDLGVPLYILSMVLVLVAIAANIRIAGLPIVALGAALNLLVIVANGGYMPASAEAYAIQGLEIPDGYSNIRFIAQPALPFLGDAIALPSWLPLGNVISVGDLLIAAGIAAAIAAAMRSRPPGEAAPGDGLPATG